MFFDDKKNTFKQAFCVSNDFSHPRHNLSCICISQPIVPIRVANYEWCNKGGYVFSFEFNILHYVI